MATFTVDTHLFRELGELLVGRDSTALVELVKNAYDADASRVIIYGDNLSDPERGTIRIDDDGTGMDLTQFEQGFLRIASRTKEHGSRQSGLYKRRFTGAKGIGRLAAHKLARLVTVQSAPWCANAALPSKGVNASIDWDAVEKHETLDDLAESDAITTTETTNQAGAPSGTIITLRRLRRRWTDDERGRFLSEAQSFEPPAILGKPLPKEVTDSPLLLGTPRIRQHSAEDPGFRVLLEGEFAGGEEYWQALAVNASWIIEIKADMTDGKVHYVVSPTHHTRLQDQTVESTKFEIDHPDPKRGPFFQGRILVREGRLAGSRTLLSWARRAAGVSCFTLWRVQ